MRFYSDSGSELGLAEDFNRAELKIKESILNECEKLKRKYTKAGQQTKECV
jgi:hypothetical protein